MKHTFKFPSHYFLTSYRAQAAGTFLALSLALTQGSGCSSTCDDDGFAWQQDELCANENASASETETDTDSNTNTETDSVTEGPTTDTLTAGSMTMSETMDTTATTSGSGTSYCVDADMDGFGDPTMCTDVPDGDTPPPGTVPNDPNDPSDDDCDDANENTHPGAGENEENSETLCQQDNDNDGYGDSDPPPGVDPGTDCDDDNVNTHPGIDPDMPDSCQQDNDMDGQGDSDPPDGVDPGLDCDDDDPNTFTGSSPNDDPNACMTDADDDDWGDDTPSNPNADPGSDCDDSDPNTFVGAAEIEDPAACMKDEDGDGWGDTSVPDGVVVGSDCYDASPNLNPDTTTLMSMFDGISGDVQQVNLETGELTTFANINTDGLPNWSVPSSALDPVSEMFFVTNASDFRLYTVDYCSDDPPTALNPHGYDLCGISFTSDGRLLGVDSDIDQVVELDPDTGDVVNTVPLVSGGETLNVGACGLTYDCVLGTVLMADFFTKKVYRIDVETGEATIVADVPDTQFGRSLAFDPVTKNVHSSNGISSVTIEIDGSNAYVQNADLMSSLDDLEFGPTCN